MSLTWEEEYDRRRNDPAVKKDTMKSWRVGGSEIRVADANGVMRRRNGEVCCGCGKGDYGPHWQDHHGFDLNKPVYDHHADYHDNSPTDDDAGDDADDDEPRGYFCSWL